MAPPRPSGPRALTPAQTRRQAESASLISGCIGMQPTAAVLGCGIAQMRWKLLSWPLASSTMSQVRFAISPARSPALVDSSTSTRLRNGRRLQSANANRSATSRLIKNFGLFAEHLDEIKNSIVTATDLTTNAMRLQGLFDRPL